MPLMGAPFAAHLFSHLWLIYIHNQSHTAVFRISKGEERKDHFPEKKGISFKVLDI